MDRLIGREYYLPETMEANLNALQANPHPGDGMIVGLNTEGDTALIACWIMDRKEDPQSRFLAGDGQIVKATIADENGLSSVDSDTYNVMRVYEDDETDPKTQIHVVSNGNQTDRVVDRLAHMSFKDLSDKLYVPYADVVPKITGCVALIASQDPIFSLHVLGKRPDTKKVVLAFGKGRLSNDKEKGVGNCVHTFGDDGRPLVPSDDSIYSVPVGKNAAETGEFYWKHLKLQGRGGALVVKAVHLATGNVGYWIRNAHSDKASRPNLALVDGSQAQ